MRAALHPSLRFAGHLGLRAPDAPLFAFSASSPAPDDQISYLQAKGFSGLFDIYLKMRPAAEQEAIARAVQLHGLTFGTFNNDLEHWNQPVWNRRTDGALALLERSIAATINLASAFPHAKAVCVTGLDDEQSEAQQVDAFIHNLRTQAELVESSGLTLLVEAVAPQWINGLLVTSTTQAAAIVRAVDHPAVRLLFDVGHSALSGEDVLVQMDAHWDLIDTIQLADAPARQAPGEGTLPWHNILQLIADNHFSGLLELEFQPEATRRSEASILAHLREFLSDI